MKSEENALEYLFGNYTVIIETDDGEVVAEMDDEAINLSEGYHLKLRKVAANELPEMCA